MARVEVHGADLNGDRIERLRVKMVNLPPRTIDRDTAIAWLRDGHSLIPVRNGRDARRLELVEIEGDEPAYFVRDDFEKASADRVEGLPKAG